MNAIAGPSSTAPRAVQQVRCTAARSRAIASGSTLRQGCLRVCRRRATIIARAAPSDESSAAISPSEVRSPAPSSSLELGVATKEFDAADLVKELVDVDSGTFGKRGEIWVVAQFVAMILVIFPPKELIWMGSFLEATCIISGVLLVYGGVNELKGNLSPLPTPRVNSELVTSGVYSIVRHPIYTGVLLTGLGITLAGGGAYGTIRIPLLAVLYWIFDNKASLEEKALSELFPGQYEEYASNVPRMVPSLAAGAFETITSGLKRKKQGGLDQ